MTRTQKKGTLDLGGLTLPLDVITEPTAILGNRGSGKSHTASILVEELLENGQQIVVSDPTDVWWGLKSSKDGKHAGYPVIVLGGKHQDAPLSAGDGKTIADFVVDERASVVLSLRHFEAQTQERAFMTAFLRRLYYRKGQETTPSPIGLWFDEASRHVPQRVDADAAQCVGAVQQCMRQGRSSGIGVGIIDQRPASVNKDVLDLVEIMIVHRVTGPLNRKALTTWIEQHASGDERKEFLAELATLPRGEAFVWSPGFLHLFERITIRDRRTFDSSYTPKVGETRRGPSTLAEIDVDALRSKLSAQIEKAAADDPVALNRRIAELERERAQMLKAPPGTKALTSEALNAARVLGTNEIRKQLRPDVMRLLNRADGIRRHVDDALGMLATLRDDIQKAVTLCSIIDDSPRASSNNIAVDHLMRAPSANTRRVLAPPGQASSLPPIAGTPGKIINALHFLETVGTSPASRAAIGGLVGISGDTGTFRTYLSALRAQRLIFDAADGCVGLTDAGRLHASSEGLPKSVDELHAVWIAKVGGTAGRMLRLLIDIFPRSYSRDALGHACGIDASTGTFRTYLSALRSPGLITDESKGGNVRAADALFPAGLYAGNSNGR